MIDIHIKYTNEMISYERLKILNKEKEVCGIPLILYMIYSFNIDISKNTDKYKLYHRIFSTQNGIYDTCNSGQGGYGIQGRNFTIQDKESFHMISQIIAYLMYEKGVLEILKAEIDNKIINFDFTKISIDNYLCTNYYEIVCTKIRFKHKSFYEYFFPNIYLIL